MVAGCPARAQQQQQQGVQEEQGGSGRDEEEEEEERLQELWNYLRFYLPNDQSVLSVKIRAIGHQSQR